MGVYLLYAVLLSVSVVGAVCVGASCVDSFV